MKQMNEQTKQRSAAERQMNQMVSPKTKVSTKPTKTNETKPNETPNARANKASKPNKHLIICFHPAVAIREQSTTDSSMDVIRTFRTSTKEIEDQLP